eukprot:TRINITY_DN154_c0_g3_i1.p1 TRINITY_DN154_c0_g3~~TRINITY_DN154_c0_g3_i1.p1  ORF type:complete len:437 (-),score=84.15 TRINITY_DN154_c0_g3_i1:866-2176(-)
MADLESGKQDSSITTPLVAPPPPLATHAEAFLTKVKVAYRKSATYIKGRLSYLKGPPDVREGYLALSEEELQRKYAEAANLDDIEVLKKFHYTAPPTAKYNAEQPFASLVRFSGTGIDMVCRRVDSWVLLGFHIFVTCIFSLAHGTATGGIPDLWGWPKISIAYIAVPSSIIIFSLTFYVNQTYDRFLTQGGHVGGAAGSLADLVLLLRVHMPNDAFPKAFTVRNQLVKFLHAMQFLAFAGMSQGQETRSDVWCWHIVAKKELLSQEQIDRLKSLMKINGSMAYKEVVLWVMRGVWAQVSNGYVDPKVAILFQQKVAVLRGHLDALFGSKNGPIPFAYYHLLLFMVNIYLLLLSYAFIFLAPWWSIPGFIIIEVAVIGMRELGNAMSNPFGTDCMDIPVYERAIDFLKQSDVVTHLPIEYPGEIPSLAPIPYKPPE